MNSASHHKAGTVLALTFLLAIVLVGVLASTAAAEPQYTTRCDQCHSGGGAQPTLTVVSQDATTVNYSMHTVSATWAVFDGDTRITYGNASDATFSAPVGHVVTVFGVDGYPGPMGVVATAYTVKPSASAGGTISPNTDTIVQAGASQAFTFTANSGYHLAEVKIDGTPNPGAVTAGSYTFTNVQAGHTIAATFAADGFVITSSAGPNGTISPLGDTTVAQGGNQSYTITPNAGYGVATLTVDGLVKPVATTYTFTNVTAAHTIAVTFKAVKPTVSLALTGLKSGKLTLGKKVTCTGTLKPARAAKAVLTFQRKVGTKWVKVTAKSATINATSGKYTYAYKPLKKGAWRVQAVVAASGAWAKATSVWKTFTVK